MTIIAGAGTAIAQPLRTLRNVAKHRPFVPLPGGELPARDYDQHRSGNGAQDRQDLFLDHPCNLKAGEKVTFILSLHGAGSSGQWQRHYFPIIDYRDKYRLVIATPYRRRAPGRLPTINTSRTSPPASSIRLAAPTSRRSGWSATQEAPRRVVVCMDFFKNKVDGFLSLVWRTRRGISGAVFQFPKPAAPGGAAVARGGRDGAPARAALRHAVRRRMLDGRAPSSPTALSCDYSHIYETGEHRDRQAAGHVHADRAIRLRHQT